MTRLLIAFLFLISMPIKFQTDVLNTITMASAAYTSGDYQTAVQLYESVVESGIDDPIVYFNLGTAYYQQGDIGQAMLNYRRTQFYWPRDIDLNRNLGRIMSERGDLQGDETGLLEGLAATTIGVLTMDELSLGVGLLWSGWFGLLGGAVLRVDWRRRLRLPIIVVGCIVLIGAILTVSRLVLATQRPPGVIVEDVVQVMSGPGEGYLELYFLHGGADLHVWEVKNGWVKFALPDGRMGWLPESTVGFVQR